MIFLILLSSTTWSSPVGHAPWVGTTLAGVNCSGDRENFGPYDYLLRAQLSGKLGIVEKYHFGPQVERLISGMTGNRSPKSIGGELYYTLKAWPNHHRALNSVIRFQFMYPKESSIRQRPPAECYLQRAIRFSPKDATAHMLYGIFLQRAGNNTEALEHYRIATELSPNDMQIKYNLALLLVELRQFEEARRYANEVYSANYPLPGLKKKLVRAGHWEIETAK